MCFCQPTFSNLPQDEPANQITGFIITANQNASYILDKMAATQNLNLTSMHIFEIL